MRCQRQILRIRCFDHVSNVKVTAPTQLPSITDTITRRRLGLFGHVAPVNNGIPARDALDCVLARSTETRRPDGWKRPHCRPRQVWVQQIDDDVIQRANGTGRDHATRSALQASDVHAF